MSQIEDVLDITEKYQKAHKQILELVRIKKETIVVLPLETQTELLKFMREILDCLIM